MSPSIVWSAHHKQIKINLKKATAAIDRSRQVFHRKISPPAIRFLMKWNATSTKPNAKASNVIKLWFIRVSTCLISRLWSPASTAVIWTIRTPPVRPTMYQRITWWNKAKSWPARAARRIDRPNRRDLTRPAVMWRSSRTSTANSARVQS